MRVQQKKKPNLTMLASEREIEQALDHGELVYLLVAKESPIEGQNWKEGSPIAELLFEFKDVFPDELPPGLPPIRGIEHQIDLIPGTSLPNKAAYRCNPEETNELQKQLMNL